MKVRTQRIVRNVEDTLTEYVAVDDMIFKTEEECLEHEAYIEAAKKLIIPNPNHVVPYDVYTSEDVSYVWVNLKTEDDIDIIENAYNVDVSGITTGIYCIEIHYDREAYISSMRYSLENAFALLELAGYDTTTLKRKNDDNV